jgi:hypothetical protein
MAENDPPIHNELAETFNDTVTASSKYTAFSNYLGEDFAKTTEVAGTLTGAMIKTVNWGITYNEYVEKNNFTPFGAGVAATIQTVLGAIGDIAGEAIGPLGGVVAGIALSNGFNGLITNPGPSFIERVVQAKLDKLSPGEQLQIQDQINEAGRHGASRMIFWNYELR